MLASSDWFTAPVTVQLSGGSGPFVPFSGNQTVGRVPAQCVAEAMIRAGLISLQPNTNGAPWYTVTPGYRVPVATREIVGHSEVRRWKEEAVQFYSETVSYRLKPLKPLAKGIPLLDGSTLSVRLTVGNDPRSNRWLFSSETFGTKALNQEAELQSVVAPMLANGGCGTKAIYDAVVAAQKQANDQLEAQLASAGTLARGAAPQTLVSRNAGLAFYIGKFNFPGERLTRENALPRAKQICADVKIAPYRNWRLPTFADVDRITTANFWWWNLPDTPDRRLWGDLEVSTDQALSVILTDDPPGNTWDPHYPLQGYWVRSPRVIGKPIVASYDTRAVNLHLVCVADA